MQKFKEIVFRGKPRRLFKSNKNKDIAFHDPKRVHTALRVMLFKFKLLGIQ